MKTLAMGALLLCVGLVAAEKETSARHAWIAFGRVADAAGKGMSGVVVGASTGVATLRPAGKTTTDEEGNYRLSFVSGLMLPLLPQSAIVSPRKAGHYERDLHQHGFLKISDKLPVDAHRKDSAQPKTVLPRLPVRLDFVMLPAATVTVRVEDRHGRPVRNQKVLVKGKKLPPGASVVRTFTTGREGVFVFEGVPRESYWFRTPGLRSNELRFTTPGRHEVELTLDRRWWRRRKKELTAKVVAKPPPAGGDKK